MPRPGLTFHHAVENPWSACMSQSESHGANSVNNRRARGFGLGTLQCSVVREAVKGLKPLNITKDS